MGPERRHYSSGSPYEDSAGFSRAVRTGQVIRVSGTAPIAPDGSSAAVGDAYGQARRCFDIIDEALQALGGSMEQVVRSRMYLTAAEHWEPVAQAHGEVFGLARPAATCVVVAGLLRPDWLVEIEVEAVVPETG